MSIYWAVAECQTCGAKPLHARGLCKPCYEAERRSGAYKRKAASR